MKVTFADMTARHCLCVLTCSVLLAESRITRSTVKDAEQYCLIDPNHTMCLFQYDDQVSSKCIDVGDNDLTEQETQLILDLHNRYRNDVASGKELRGNLGPQPTAKHMMELVWDDELAYIARRWALQCNLGEKDRCRDVERFAVWQNVDSLYIDGVGSGTTSRTLRHHIQRWYDQVESFDASKVGMVDLADERNLTPYIAFASATITYVGCGRAIYTVDTNETAAAAAAAAAAVSEDGDEAAAAAAAAAAVGNGEFTRRRLVDELVCNYGPVDRTQPQQLYETGQPGSCPPGTKSSTDYSFLCRKFEEPFEPRKTHRPRGNPEKRKELSAAAAAAAGAVPRVSAQLWWLAEPLTFFLLLLLRLLSM